jgi:o-succinylbenzoate synthase
MIKTPRIEYIRWFPYTIPLRSNFSTAHSVLTARTGAIVEIVCDNNLSGNGEIAPLPDFAGDDLSTALAPLPTFSPEFYGRTPLDALDFLYMMTHVLPATTVCGLESALLDILGKSLGCGVYELGVVNAGVVNAAPTVGVGARIAVNMVIGAMALDDVIVRAREAVQAGYSCIKLKVGKAEPDMEIARIAALRQAVGPDVHLRLDANEAWTFAEAMTILTQCAPFTLQYVEQPLPARNLDEMRALRYNVPVPIAADEAVYDLESARRVLAHEAAQVLILKPQLAGGLRAGRQIISEATLHGVQCVITSTIETGVGIAGALHLAATSPEVTLECGLATLHLLADDLLIDHLVPKHGFLAVPTGFGLGIRLDRNALAHYRTDRKDYL